MNKSCHVANKGMPKIMMFVRKFSKIGEMIFHGHWESVKVLSYFNGVP